MYKHILIPTDGSELSAAAIRQGIHLAKSIGAKVTGLCVMPMQIPFFYQKRMPKAALEESYQRLKKISRRSMPAGVEPEGASGRSRSAMVGGGAAMKKSAGGSPPPDFSLDFSGRVGRYFSYSPELLPAPRSMGERFTASSAGWF